METRCFLVPVCSLPCSRCLEDQQYGCVKSPGGTPLRHRQRMSSRWIPLFMVLQYTVYSDLILQWHPENPVGLFTSQTTRALDFVLLDQWSRISSGTGNIQTRDRLAFSIPYEYNFFPELSTTALVYGFPLHWVPFRVHPSTAYFLK